jgi:hypothetical protein
MLGEDYRSAAILFKDKFDIKAQTCDVQQNKLNSNAIRLEEIDDKL